MKIKDLYLGKIDAKNELLYESDEEIKNFLATFIIPPNIVPKQYQNKEKYFVSGLKGTGKTALLRYLGLKSKKNNNIHTKFILFKTDFDDIKKQEFSKTASNLVTDNNSKNSNEKDYEMTWRWFLYRSIVDIVINDKLNVFKTDDNWESFKELIEAPNYSSKTTYIKSLIPKITKGQIEISKSPKLKLNLKWDENNKSKIKFSDLVYKADEYFKLLKTDATPLYIYLDELELSFDNNKNYQRDIVLIRDLIVSMEKLNGISKKIKLNICFFAAIRTEVVNSVQSSGKEINKILSDFGTPILWHKKAIEETEQPLLSIITKKIIQSEINYDLNMSDNELRIWKEYFPEHINKFLPQTYILHHSWYRPRDMVRLLNIAKNEFPNEEKFTHKMFNDIAKSYSTESWNEITEELKAKYKNEEILAIEKIFYGFSKKYFSLKDIKERCEEIMEYYPEVKNILTNYEIPSILSDLYRIGVIGNIKKGGKGRNYIRYSFRGDDNILFEQNMLLHQALKAHMSVR
jgi:hypothetical protein